MAALLKQWQREGRLTPACAPKAVLDAKGDGRFRELAFTFAIIALSVKLARAGRGLSKERYLAFREAFPLEDAVSAKLRSLFALAWEDAADAVSFARQIVYLYPSQPELWRAVMARLCLIANAAGPIAGGELKQLAAVAAVFGMTRVQLQRMVLQSDLPLNPFETLGVARRSALPEIRSRYHALMRAYHPDSIAAHITYPEGVEVARRKATAVTTAYQTALRKKGVK